MISAANPHAGGYVANAKRYVARPGSLGANADDQVPAAADLRAFAPAVGDQGSIGACVAWTIAHNIMGYYANRTGCVDAPYAPLFLYLRNVAAGGAPTRGLNPDSVLANAQSAGVDSQDDYFQGTTNYKVAPTSAAPARRAGAVPVVIVGPGGTSAGRTFTYRSAVPPVLTSLSRTTGSTKTQTATVITGSYLSKATIVTAAGKRTSFKRVSDTRLTVTLARHAAGPVAIKVVSAGGTSNTLTFTYVAP